MKVKEIITKVFCLIMLYAILPAFGNICIINASTQTSCSSNIDKGSLYKAFLELSNLDTFEKFNTEEIDYLFPPELGKSQGLIAPNSHLRDDILKILKDIPYNHLYSETRSQKDNISRCYIEQLPSGIYQMMYVIVGHGSNDVVIALFTNEQVNKFTDFGNAIKQVNFEELEDTVLKINAECPILVAKGIEMISMSIDEKYWTIRIKIIANEKDLSCMSKEFGRTLLNVVSKYNISQVFNLNIGLKLVFTNDAGDESIIFMEHDDLANILNDIDIPQN